MEKAKKSKQQIEHEHCVQTFRNSFLMMFHARIEDCFKNADIATDSDIFFVAFILCVINELDDLIIGLNENPDIIKNEVIPDLKELIDIKRSIKKGNINEVVDSILTKLERKKE